jgi:bifunctional DNase/RNase
MSKAVIEVRVRAVAAMSNGCAVFLGNEQKVFVMSVDSSVGAAIAMAMQDAPRQRPLTHDLIANVLGALGAKVQRVIVNDFQRDTYFARLILSAENERAEKRLIELDARPSDGIAVALQQRAPIYVNREVWQGVEDMTEALRGLQQGGLDTEEGQGQEGA